MTCIADFWFLAGFGALFAGMGVAFWGLSFVVRAEQKRDAG
jgi:hypothetical protein